MQRDTASLSTAQPLCDPQLVDANVEGSFVRRPLRPAVDDLPVVLPAVTLAEQCTSFSFRRPPITPLNTLPVEEQPTGVRTK